MPTPCERFQSLLHELFQFELSDLDFGIYRLFRLKKDELDRFIKEQIPQAVEKAFADVAEGDTGKLKAEVADLAQKIREELELDAILDDGSLNPRYDKNAIGKTVRLMVNDYEEKFKRLRGLLATENQKDDVFNHLHAFFSRYYDRGDFIARRFFGARPHYAVPYNGEETHFHWANKDQYYVKSGEAFRDYSFTVDDILGGPARVRFALTKASLPPGDTKGDRRYSFPQPGESKWDAASRTYTIAFHYRLPVEAELKSAPVEENGAAGESGNGEIGDGENGKAAKPKKISGDKLQEKLLADALDALIAACPEAGLADALRKVVNQEDVERDGKLPVTYLAKRMRHFARRQTSDYFVHKNLAAFLREELDFYVKDQVIHAADLDGDFEGKRRMLRALRELAGQLIAFLHQIEEVQRRLFEKRKFVLRTGYLCPVQNVPRALWREICANRRQLAEWVDLYALGKDGAGDDDFFAFRGRLTESFLENHPTLVVNTALFDEDFKWRLLESFDDLDAVLDGVLVQADNRAGLGLLEMCLRERVKCTYIDPPYNTGFDDFLYKDRYQHSTWVSMMSDALKTAGGLMSSDGVVLVSIGKQELFNLSHLTSQLFPADALMGVFVWKARVKPVNIGDAKLRPQNENEYVLALERNKGAGKFLPLPAAAGRTYPHTMPDGRKYRLATILKSNRGLNFRRTMSFTVEGYTPPEGQRWQAGEDEIPRLFKNGYIEFKDGTPFRRYFEDEEGDAHEPLYCFMPEETSGTSEIGKQELNDILTNQHGFDTVKPTSLVRTFTKALVSSRGWLLDFFGGSGTTGDACIQINQQDGERRRFALCEIGGYFDRLLLPRIQKVMFSPEWRGGKPSRMPTKDEASRIPRLVKVLRLESYEDALHNLATDAALAASEAKAAAFQGALGAETYRLHYLVRLPLEASASMLQTARLDHPFRYSLEILTDDGAEARTVDLVETFNWLLGLDVQRVRQWQHEKRDYLAVLGRDRGNKRVLVVWRDTADLDPKAERAFLEKQVATLTKDTPFDRMLINGDSATPGFESLDGLFKQLMEAE